MKAFLIYALLVTLLLTGADATRIMGNPNAQSVEPNLVVERIDIQANATGYFSEQTESTITGELVGIAWDKGNFTGVGTTTLKAALPAAVQIDSFNLSTGSAFRLPGIKLQGSTDEYGTYNLFSPLWVNMTGGQSWGKATLYIFWR
jgi:hypothetical protein